MIRLENNNLVKHHTAEEIGGDNLHKSFGEEGVVIDGVRYRNVNMVEHDGHHYIVSHKAVLTLSVTAVCNANCDFCYNGITFFPSGKTAVKDRSKADYVIDFAQKSGVRNVSISGGEPTLYPQLLINLFEQVKSRFPGFRRLHTNGSNLFRDIDHDGLKRPLYQHLKSIGLNDLSISMAHYRPAVNAAIMKLPQGRVLVPEQIRDLAAAFSNLRFSCFVSRNGINSPEAMLDYIQQLASLGVRHFVFRIATSIPSIFEFPSSYAEVNGDFTQHTQDYCAKLLQAGFSQTFRREDVDYDLSILQKGDVIVSIDRSSDVPDPDRKIRRINFMPNGITYSSWIEASSVLFPKDHKSMVDGANEQEPFKGNFPAHAARRKYFTDLQAGEPMMDMHFHSTVSDGRLSPSDTIRQLVKHGIRGGVLTDHNCVHDNFKALQSFSRSIGFDMPFAGTEVSVIYETKENRYLFHMLVYGDGVLDRDFLKLIGQANNTANEHMYTLYNRCREQGLVEEDFDGIFNIGESEAGLGSKKYMCSRNPLAKAIAMRTGLTIDEAKAKYLPPMNKAVQYEQLPHIQDVLEYAGRLGCVSILAHTGWMRTLGEPATPEQMLRNIITLSGIGLDGVEVHHRLNNAEWQKKLMGIARTLDLLITGGSDYHGKEKDLLGLQYTSPSNFQRLQQRLAVKSVRL